VPKLNENEVLVPGSLALRFDIDLDGGHANNFLVQNVTRALVDKLVVKFAGPSCKTWWGTTSTKRLKTCSSRSKNATTWCRRGSRAKTCARYARTQGTRKRQVSTLKKKLNEIFGSKYYIRLDHQIVTDHGIFYPQVLYNDLIFEVTLASAAQVVRGSDPTKLKYKLTNIQLEYEMIRSKFLGEEALSLYQAGKEFAYDHVMRHKVVTFKEGSDSRLNIKVDAQKRSLKGILLLFLEPYAAGARDSEKFTFPDITKVSVTINGSPNMLYNEGIESKDMWKEASRFLVKEKSKTKT